MTVRLRNITTGVVVSVAGEKVSRLGREWEPVAAPTPSETGHPDSTWTVKELRAYARDHDITLGTVTSKGDILAVIAEA